MNRTVFEMYEITGSPNHFLTVKARDLYNWKIRKWCEKLKESETDLRKSQKLKRFFLIIYLDILDILEWRQSH